MLPHNRSEKKKPIFRVKPFKPKIPLSPIGYIMTEELAEQEQQLANKYREYIIDLNGKSQDELDKAILTLSSFGIGLVLTLSKNIHDAKKILLHTDVEKLSVILESLFLLKVTWILWCSSIICVLSSHYLAQHLTLKLVENSNTYKSFIEEYNNKKFFFRFIAILNFLASFLFLVGILLLGYFSFFIYI